MSGRCVNRSHSGSLHYHHLRCATLVCVLTKSHTACTDAPPAPAPPPPPSMPPASGGYSSEEEEEEEEEGGADVSNGDGDDRANLMEAIRHAGESRDTLTLFASQQIP